MHCDCVTCLASIWTKSLSSTIDDRNTHTHTHRCSTSSIVCHHHLTIARLLVWARRGCHITRQGQSHNPLSNMQGWGFVWSIYNDMLSILPRFRPTVNVQGGVQQNKDTSPKRGLGAKPSHSMIHVGGQVIRGLIAKEAKGSSSKTNYTSGHEAGPYARHLAARIWQREQTTFCRPGKAAPGAGAKGLRARPQAS